MNTYGHSESSGRLRHASISPYTFLSLSESVREGMRSPHSSRPVSSTRLVDTPARYMSINDSSTLCSRRRYRSTAADSKTAPSGFSTFSSGLPALAVRLRS